MTNSQLQFVYQSACTGRENVESVSKTCFNCAYVHRMWSWSGLHTHFLSRGRAIRNRRPSECTAAEPQYSTRNKHRIIRDESTLLVLNITTPVYLADRTSTLETTPSTIKKRVHCCTVCSFAEKAAASSPATFNDVLSSWAARQGARCLALCCRFVQRARGRGALQGGLGSRIRGKLRHRLPGTAAIISLFWLDRLEGEELDWPGIIEACKLPSCHGTFNRITKTHAGETADTSE